MARELLSVVCVIFAQGGVMSVRFRITGFGFAVALLQMAIGVQAYDLQIGRNYTSSTLWSDYDTRPPDTTGAVGPGAVVEFTNGSYRCYDKSTGTLVAADPLNGFWQAAGATPAGDGAFGPRVIYDLASSRWFASAADDRTGSGNILLAVSNTSDPLDGWQAFSIDPDPADTFQFDAPALGINADGVFVCANANDGNGNASLVLSVPKSDLTSIVPSVTNCTLLFPGDPQTLGYGLQPAVDFGLSVGRGALLAVDYTAFGVLDHTSVLGADTPSASLSGTTYIDVPATSYPPRAAQPGGAWPIDTGDDTIQSSVYKVGGSLWAVHTIDVAGRAGLQWYEIDEATSTLLQSGTISDADYDYYCPSICANDAGVVVIAFNRSGGSPGAGPGCAPDFGSDGTGDEYASLYAALGETSGGTTTFGVPLALVTGSDTYEVSPDGDEINAWGRHSALVRDPDDPFTFWAFGQYASGANEYSTRIVELHTNSIEAVPEPGTLGLVAVGLLGLIAWRRRAATAPKA
jgi:hypothetical protein